MSIASLGVKVGGSKDWHVSYVTIFKRESKFSLGLDDARITDFIK